MRNGSIYIEVVSTGITRPILLSNSMVRIRWKPDRTYKYLPVLKDRLALLVGISTNGKTCCHPAFIPFHAGIIVTKENIFAICSC
jgi:hypothetical protein